MTTSGYSMHHRTMRVATLAVLTLGAGPVPAAVDFVKDIQPIFAEHCYQCHGAQRSEADFRLDNKQTALKGGELGPAIIPGKAAESLLVAAVSGTKPKLKMPRKGDPLSSEQISKLKTWIDEGAVWPESASASLVKGQDHWAFKPPVKAALPQVSNHKSQIANPIDAFVRARLEKEHLKPSPPASPEKLVRRLHLDLTGLPPSPQEVDAFVKDHSPEAYKATVEKLLASPHYGELWGRHWLDAARYADSNGYEKDPMRFIWFYRDWVINAFNRDLPYDQFVIQQLAGDQLPHATQDQIVATGFLRNSMVNEEGGVDPEQFRMEAMFDRMDAIGKSILGLSINCCQCHNHKYDPITQEEYYRMFAFLNNDNEPGRVVHTPTQQQAIADMHRRIRAIEDRIKMEHPDWRERLNAWATKVREAKQPEWHTLQAPFTDSVGGQKNLLLEDGSFLAQSYAPTKSAQKFIVSTPSTKITAFRLELMNDPNLPAYGPGRAQNGACALTEFEVESAPLKPVEANEGDKVVKGSRPGVVVASVASYDATAKPVKSKFASATADFGEPENTPLVKFARDQDAAKDKRVTGPIQYAIDGDDKTAWGIDAGPGRRNVPRNAVFVLDKPIESKDGVQLGITLSQKHGGWNSDDLQTMNLGRFRVSWTDAPDAVADPVPPAVRRAVMKGDVDAAFSYFRTTVPEWKAANEEIEALWKQHPEGTTTLVLENRETPRTTTMLKRGDFTKPGDEVKPGVPAALNPLPKTADGSRLTFAKWIVDRKSPTTARAFVNRVWQAYFGTGLTATPEDLGTQGETPSHPELLDWLACDFMGKGWSMKALHRLIVNSETYQQDSKVSAELLARDPFNRLLARGPRFRVEGEVVRDIQLATSGLLNPEVGGRAVMPPAPAYLFEKPASYAPFPWHVDGDGEQFRRAVYVFRRRSTPYPFLSTFDVPNGETSCVRRAKSNTPMQALMTLNETMSMEAAAALASRMKKEGGADDASRIAYGFKICTARAPSANETKALLDLMKRQQARQGTDAVDGYTIVARVLLNLDETITKE